MAVKDELLSLADKLDKRKIGLPALITVTDEQQELEYRASGKQTSYTDFARTLLKAGIDKYCLRSVVRCMQEIEKSQNSRLWAAFVARGSELRITYNQEAVDEGTSGMSFDIAHILYDKKLKQPVDRYEMEAVLDYNRSEVFDDSIHHELGHFVDDSHHTLKDGNPIHLENMHSASPIWKQLIQLDQTIYPFSEFIRVKSESDLIVQNLTELRDYSPDPKKWSREKEWDEEFFSQMVARHFGPTTQPGLLSPLFKIYVNNIVDLDLSIMLQNKPAECIREDREALHAALAKPIDAYIDQQRLGELLKQWNDMLAGNSQARPKTHAQIDIADEQARRELVTQKKILVTAIEQCVAQGLNRLFREVTGQIGFSHVDALAKAPTTQPGRV